MGGAASRAIMSSTPSEAVGVDAAAPRDDDRSNMTMKPTPTVIFRKVYPGEVPDGEPDAEALKLAMEIITRKYGSWVLTTGFGRLGDIPWERLYESGEKAWEWAYRHSFRAQWGEDEWAAWQAEQCRKRQSYDQKWSEEEWRQWVAECCADVGNDAAGRKWSEEEWRQWMADWCASVGDDAAGSHDPSSRHRSRSPRARALASSYAHYNGEGSVPYTAGAGSAASAPGATTAPPA